METNQIRKFFVTLFPKLTDSFIELRCIRPPDDIVSEFYDNIEQLVSDKSLDIEAQNGYGLYFGVCLRSKKEGNKDSVKQVRSLWADIDWKDYSGGQEEALRRLKEFPLKPTAIVCSGHGYQSYWCLREPEATSNPDDVVRVEGFLKRLAIVLGADRNAAEIARVLRLPGTYNLKDPSKPVPVTIFQLEEGLQYNLSDFEPFLPALPTSPQSSNLPGWISQSLADLHEGNRNGIFAKIVGRLHNDGWLPDDILNLLTPHAEHCGFPIDELSREIEGICQRYPSNKSSLSSSSAKLLLESSTSKFNEILSITQQSAEKKLTGIRTYFPELDQFTNGLRGIVVLGGPPKIGKSTYSLNIAANVAESGHPVIYCDFENGTEKLSLKILSRLSKFTCAEILTNMNGLRNTLGYESIKERFLSIGKNLFIHRPSLKDVKQDNGNLLEASNILLEKYVNYIKEELKIDKDILIIVDSLQKLPSWSMSERRGNIDSWLRAFERTKNSFGVTFLVISELTRGTYENASIDAFKESGDIEYTADLAIQMKKGEDENHNFAIEMHAVANRDGDIGLISKYRPFYDLSYFEESTECIIRG